jgi:hypothetical protein
MHHETRFNLPRIATGLSQKRSLFAVVNASLFLKTNDAKDRDWGAHPLVERARFARLGAHGNDYGRVDLVQD